ncbi:MAG: hypothetical protein AAFV93_20815, partial [Chloroflexota bacterium]
MPFKDDYNEAVNLVKQGRYTEAKDILLRIDHPKAKALLEKINHIPQKNKVSEQYSEFPKGNAYFMSMWIVGQFLAMIVAGFLITIPINLMALGTWDSSVSKIYDTVRLMLLFFPFPQILFTSMALAQKWILKTYKDQVFEGWIWASAFGAL